MIGLSSQDRTYHCTFFVQLTVVHVRTLNLSQSAYFDSRLRWRFTAAHRLLKTVSANASSIVLPLCANNGATGDEDEAAHTESGASGQQIKAGISEAVLSRSRAPAETESASVATATPWGEYHLHLSLHLHYAMLAIIMGNSATLANDGFYIVFVFFVLEPSNNQQPKSWEN